MALPGSTIGVADGIGVAGPERNGEHRAAGFAHDLIGYAAPDQAGHGRPRAAGQHDQVGWPCGCLPGDRDGHIAVPGIDHGGGGPGPAAGPRPPAGPPPARPWPGRWFPGRTWRRCAAAGRRSARGPGAARRWSGHRSASPPPAPGLTRPAIAPGPGSGGRGICRPQGACRCRDRLSRAGLSSASPEPPWELHPGRQDNAAQSFCIATGSPSNPWWPGLERELLVAVEAGPPAVGYLGIHAADSTVGSGGGAHHAQPPARPPAQRPARFRTPGVPVMAARRRRGPWRTIPGAFGRRFW